MKEFPWTILIQQGWEYHFDEDAAQSWAKELSEAMQTEAVAYVASDNAGDWMATYENGELTFEFSDWDAEGLDDELAWEQVREFEFYIPPIYLVTTEGKLTPHVELEWSPYEMERLDMYFVE